MRHAVFGRKLGRDINSRKALLANMASDLFVNKAIITTLAKAKFARVHTEKLVTDAKRNKLFINRRVASKLTHPAFIKLTQEIAPGFGKRSGGYTRIIKLTSRRGDDAPMARLELLDWEKKVESQSGKSKSEQKQLSAPKSAETKTVKPAVKNDQRKSTNKSA